MISAGVFVALAVIGCAAAVLAVLGITQLSMSGGEAIERDGMARGRRAPAWALADSRGVIHRSPPAAPLQLVLFADHSLKSFPSVVDGLRQLAADDPQVEIVLLLRRPSQIAGPVLSLLGLGGVPVLTGSPALYAAYNVRVAPFAIFTDSAGRVRASSLVNHAWQIAKLSRLARIPLGPDELRAAARGPAAGWRRAAGLVRVAGRLRRRSAGVAVSAE
jgi:hypothetical protein